MSYFLSDSYYSIEYDAGCFSNTCANTIMHFTKIQLLPVMLVGFADVLLISETIVDTGCDVVDGSADTVDELTSTDRRYIQ